MRMHVPIVVTLLIAHAAFLMVGAYAESLQVVRLPEKVWGFVLPDGFADSTGRYIMPVLFPLDLIVMVLVAGATAWAAATWGPQISGWPVVLFLVLPLAYLAFDLVEDGLLILVLGKCIAAGSVSTVLPLLTKAKIVTFVGTWIVAVGTGALAYWRTA